MNVSLNTFQEAYRGLLRHLPNRGVYVYDEEWDNLIILDACRYDTFRELNTIDGRLESRISRGSATQEFLIENFRKHPRKKTFEDIVYVSSNPFVSLLLPGIFHMVYPVWDYGWDENLLTIPPEPVVKAALEARRLYPDKRMIIHFMQPHFPPLVGRPQGDTGQALKRLSGFARDGANPDKVLNLKRGYPPHVFATTTDGLLARGLLTKQEVLSLYRENLRIVLSHVDGMLKQLSGVSVITGDHGNLFGERLGVLYPFRVYGHWPGLRLAQLVLVPWLITANHSRGVIPAHESAECSSARLPEPDEEKIKDRLRKLGYE
jgi:hypothetical protein